MKTYQLNKSNTRTHWGIWLLLAITCFHPPIALAQLTAPATSRGTYTVSWTEQSGGQTRAYLYERENQQRWKKTTVTGTNRRTFTKPQGTYSYKLQICFFEPELNRELCNPFGNEATVVVSTTPGIPGVPGSLGGNITNTTGTYTLAWNAASGTVTRYELEERIGHGRWNRIHNANSRTKTVTRADGSYDYRVRACNTVNSDGCGGYTTTKRVIVLKAPGIPGTLGPDITVPPIAYVISWGASSGTVDSYELQERKLGDVRWALVHNSATRSRTFRNKPPAVYDYRVRACNNPGNSRVCSNFTAIKRVTVELETNIIEGPTDLDGCYTLRWADSPDEAELEERGSDGKWKAIKIPKSRTATSVDICRFESRTYQYRLRHCIPAEPGFNRFCLPFGKIHDVDVAFAAPRFKENSGILGGQNLARTKDADVADINNDGYLDILDANSNNSGNGSDVVIRFNNGASSTGFSTQVIGPRDDAVSYDSDLVDLNNDNFPDLIRTQSFSPTNNQIAIFLNREGVSNQWFVLDQPDFTARLTNCPDDIAFGDLDNDDDMDFAVTQRLRGACRRRNGTSTTSVFLNDGNGSDFTLIANLSAPPNQSTHDAFFIDADNDGNLDIFSVNESGVNSGRLWLSNGQPRPGFTLSSSVFATAYAGSAADFNGDGWDDFVLGGNNVATVYLNNSVGQFTATALSNTTGTGSFYDMELGDLDVDGDIDIVGVALNGSSPGQVRIWLNDGLGSFTSFNGKSPLPNHVDNQRLSADLIDYDNDGDPDLYVTGGDGQNLGCFGCVPNQFFENGLPDNNLP